MVVGRDKVAVGDRTEFDGIFGGFGGRWSGKLDKYRGHNESRSCDCALDWIESFSVHTKTLSDQANDDRFQCFLGY